MTAPAERRDDLGPILDTLREVNESLERRARRATAANAVTWGLVASSIFAFYAWAHANRDATLVQALGEAGFLPWMWAPPVLLGYVATLATGARLGRIAPRSAQAQGARWLTLALLVPVAAVVLSNLTGVGLRLIPAMWVAFLGVVHLNSGCMRGDALDKAVLWGSFALAPLLPFLPYAWANAAASLWYLAALAGYGAWRHHEA